MSGFNWTASSVGNIAVQLVENVATALVGTSSGRPGRACFMPGTEVAWDDCECGQLALVITQSLPSRRFPQAAIDQWTPCHDLIMVFDMQLSLVRCVPGPGTNGEAPTCTALSAAAIVQEEDRYVMWAALNCFLRSLSDSSPKIISDYIINDAPTLGPQGSCGGIQINFKLSQYIPCEC